MTLKVVILSIKKLIIILYIYIFIIMNKNIIVVSYNTFYEENEEQINILKNINADIISFQESSNNKFKNYFNITQKSHLNYTKLLLKNTLFTEFYNFTDILNIFGVIFTIGIIETTPIIIIAIHLEPYEKGYEEREKQILQINEFILKNKLEDLQIIMAGDTNMRDNEHIISSTIFKDIYLNHKMENNYTTYPTNQCNKPQFNDKYITKKVWRYDKIFVNNINSNSYETINTTFSDHYLIKSELNIYFSNKNKNKLIEILKLHNKLLNNYIVDIVERHNSLTFMYNNLICDYEYLNLKFVEKTKNNIKDNKEIISEEIIIIKDLPKEIIKEKKQTELLINEFKCSYCNICFANKSNLNRHYYSCKVKNNSNNYDNLTNSDNLDNMDNLTNLNNLDNSNNLNNLTNSNNSNNLTDLNNLTDANNLTNTNNLTDANNLTNTNNSTDTNNLTNLMNSNNSNDLNNLNNLTNLNNSKIISEELQKFNRKVEKYKNKLLNINKSSIEYNEIATKFLKYKSKFFADKNNRDIYENYTNKKLDNYTIKYNHIVFDIETNASSDILQVAYEIYNEEFKLINKKNIYINDGIHYTDYYKKINRDLIVKKGITPDEALEIIIKDFNNSKILVGHNIIGFDIQKINQYIIKHNLHYKIKNDIIYHDTMLNTNNIVKSKNINGKEKSWCKLSELYKHLFPNNQTEQDDLHDATYDVFLTSQCYEKLVKEHNFSFEM